MTLRFDEGKCYAEFRPNYPDAFFNALRQHLPIGDIRALDVGTGTGQVAEKLASFCTSIDAIDISPSQLEHAIRKPNIRYHLASAEQLPFESASFDLITVGQAVHWFQFDQFYAEVRRVSKPTAVIAIVGYGNIILTEMIMPIISHFYSEVLRDYWDKERRHIDSAYTTIPFPFEEIAFPAFSISSFWTLDQLLGYLSTWSALKRYRQVHSSNPLEFLSEHLLSLWPINERFQVSFPVLTRIGRII
ncbi:MAG: class I SAM-dependent methyltransferase [Chloroherpetonaceae bacterium]|nr:class I SAM-dependent methyltransferase [Chloroherpetonaceae bacterium]